MIADGHKTEKQRREREDGKDKVKEEEGTRVQESAIVSYALLFPLSPCFFSPFSLSSPSICCPFSLSSLMPFFSLLSSFPRLLHTLVLLFYSFSVHLRSSVALFLLFLLLISFLRCMCCFSSLTFAFAEIVASCSAPAPARQHDSLRE